jgi:hypothetical protein
LNGLLLIGVLAVPTGSETTLVEIASKIHSSIDGTWIIQEFTPTIVGGHEAATGIISSNSENFHGKVALIKFDSNTLYLLQFIAPKDSFSNTENNQVMNRAIASVSFTE